MIKLCKFCKERVAVFGSRCFRCQPDDEFLQRKVSSTMEDLAAFNAAESITGGEWAQIRESLEDAVYELEYDSPALEEFNDYAQRVSKHGEYMVSEAVMVYRDNDGSLDIIYGNPYNHSLEPALAAATLTPSWAHKFTAENLQEEPDGFDLVELVRDLRDEFDGEHYFLQWLDNIEGPDETVYLPFDTGRELVAVRTTRSEIDDAIDEIEEEEEDDEV